MYGVMCGGTAEAADRANREAIQRERARFQLEREHCDFSQREHERMLLKSRAELFSNVGPGG